MLFFFLSFDYFWSAQEVTTQLKVFDYSVLEILERPTRNNNLEKNPTRFHLNTARSRPWFKSDRWTCKWTLSRSPLDQMEN